MLLRQKRFMLVPAALAITALVGCGGNPSSPSSGGVELQGIVLQAQASVSAQSVGVPAQAASSSKITVTVEGTSISAKVSGNGTFVLKNVPAGEFTLVFTMDGTVIGTIPVTVVTGTKVIKVVVQVDQSSVTLVSLDFETENENEGDQGDQQKTCIINGGKVGQRIELEGNVSSGDATTFVLDVNGNRSSATGIVTVNASAASFKCNGNPNKTTDCKLQVTTGAKVHVRGTLTACDLSTASVTATEVKVQK